MNMDKDGGNAFPIPGLQEDPDFNGMSLRDYFAAKAMQAWLTTYERTDEHPSECDGALTAHAVNAYAMADAMLAARGPQ
jgi:hypothetical protein